MVVPKPFKILEGFRITHLAALDDDCEGFVSGSVFGTVLRWSVVDFQSVEIFRFESACACLAAGEGYIAAGCVGRRIMVSPSNMSFSVKGSNPTSIQIFLCSDGRKKLALGLQNGEVHIYGLDDLQCLHIDNSHELVISSLQIVRNSPILIATSWDRCFSIYDDLSLVELNRFDAYRPLTCSAIISDSRTTQDHFVILGGENGLFYMSLEADDHEINPIFDWRSQTKCICVHNDLLFAGFYDRTVRSLSIRRRCPMVAYEGHDGPILAIVVVGDCLITASSDCRTRVFKIDVDLRDSGFVQEDFTCEAPTPDDLTPEDSDYGWMDEYSDQQGIDDSEAFERLVVPPVPHVSTPPVVSIPNDPSNPTGELCILCATNKCTMVTIPCGHLCLCEACCGKIDNRCPICRHQTEMVVKVFKAGFEESHD